MKTSEWLKIEKEFVEWDKEGGFNYSQRQIMDWFEVKFTEQTAKLKELNEARKGLIIELERLVNLSDAPQYHEIIRAKNAKKLTVEELRQKINSLEKEIGG